MSLLNQQQASPSSSLSIVIDNCNGDLTRGVILSGKVLLIIHSDFVDIQTLSIQITGEENIQYRALLFNSMATSYRTENALFLNLPQIAVSEQRYVRGSYSFPFTFQLPKGVPIPVSFHRKSMVNPFITSRLKWSSVYKLEAFLRFSNFQTISCLYDFKNPTSSVLLGNKLPICITPKSIKLRGGGQITLGLYLPNSILTENENFTISYFIQNVSRTQIKNVHFTVKEYITFKARFLNWSTEVVSFIPTNVGFGEEISIKTSQHSLKKVYVESDMYLTSNDIKYDLETMKYSFDGKMPNRSDALKEIPVMMSFPGQFVQIRYELIMTVITSFGTNNPSISVPVTLQPAVAVAVPSSLPPSAVPDFLQTPP
jgi:hypothetical protein